MLTRTWNAVRILVLALTCFALGCVGTEENDPRFDDPRGEIEASLVAKGVYVSLFSNRSSPVLITTATSLDKRAYIFTDGYPDVARVEFSNIDQLGTVHRTESWWPYDFNGSESDVKATEYDFSPLSIGIHQLKVRVVHTNGTSESTTVSFRRGGATPPPPVDAGTPAPVDAGKPTPVDAGTPAPVDAGKPTPVDAGTPAPVDAGSPTPVDAGSGVTTIAGCQIYPADNAWNRDISADPVDTVAMANVMPNLSPNSGLHADWGDTTENYGIPFNVVSGAPRVPMTWSESWGYDESDQLPCASGGGLYCYPFPPNAKIEGGSSAPVGSDRHVLVLDTTGAPNNCTLYEVWQGFKDSTGAGWTASNGAIFHLGTNALRPDGWTSADAAGLPILPGLIRFDEANAGEIKHAIRFTMNNSYQGYIHPATHAAGLSDSNGIAHLAMGQRLRLKASFDTTGWTGPALAIAKAMKKYGLIFADNGSNWFISGETHDGWTPVMSNVVSRLGSIHGRDFEIVQSGPISKNGL
jgi:hypothetical protein